MEKSKFWHCAQVLREYALWERKLYEAGIDLASQADNLAECMLLTMKGFDYDWGYDKKLGFDWIIEWTHTPDSPNFFQKRHGIEFDLTDAGALYDFIVFMTEHGWED